MEPRSGRRWRGRGADGDCLDGADGGASAAADAAVGGDPGQKARGGDRVQEPESAGGQEAFAAAAAAVADEVDPMLHIFPELYQAMLLGLVQQVESFSKGDAAGGTVSDQGLGGMVERGADIERGPAGAAQVGHFVSAVAEPDRDGRGGTEDLGDPLVVEDLQGGDGGQGGLLHEHPARLRLATGHQALDEILLDIDVLVEQLAEQLLVDVGPHPHQGEFEKTGHGRGQGVDRPAVALDVEQDGAVGQLLEDSVGGGGGGVPAGGGLGGGERGEGQAGDQAGLALGEQQPEDLVQKVGRRRPLGKPVQPVDQALVGLSHSMVRHVRRGENRGCPPRGGIPCPPGETSPPPGEKCNASPRGGQTGRRPCRHPRPAGCPWLRSRPILCLSSRVVRGVSQQRHGKFGCGFVARPFNGSPSPFPGRGWAGTLSP